MLAGERVVKCFNGGQNPSPAPFAGRLILAPIRFT